MLTDKDAVLAANLDFYRAFATHDARAMAAVWAARLPIACLHPGWPMLRTREAVLQSWRDILANPEAPRVVCHDEEAFLYGETAVVTCEEQVGTGSLAATNVFAREDGTWRLVLHQAGPILIAERPQPPAPRGRLN